QTGWGDTSPVVDNGGRMPAADGGNRPAGLGFGPAPRAMGKALWDNGLATPLSLNPAASCGSAPSGESGMFRSPVVTTRLATPLARDSYIGELGFTECPSPSAWPSSWVTVVSTSYWSAPI